MTDEERAARVVKMRYVIVVAVVGPFLGMILLAAYITVVGQNSRAATCKVVRAQQIVFVETPPTTPAGFNAQEAWNGLSKTLHCEPVA